MKTPKLWKFTLVAALALGTASVGLGQQAQQTPEEKKVSKDTVSLGTAMMHGMQTATAADTTRCPMCGGIVKPGTMMSSSGMRGGMMGRKTGMMRGMASPGDAVFTKLVRRIQSLPEQTQQLALSDQQVKSLSGLRAEFRKGQADFQAALQKARVDLKSLISKESSTEKVNSALDRALKAERDLKLNIYETYIRALNVLTPEQRSKLAAMDPGHPGMRTM